MKRREVLAIFASWSASSLIRAAAIPPVSLRGTLLQTPEKPSAIVAPNHHRISLAGDESSTGVLLDERLQGVDFEVLGHYTSADRFLVDPIHTRSLFVHKLADSGDKSDKRMIVTYWCDVCSIRTYTPGLCWCCRKYTDLDLRESDDR